jgi:Uma2 family endonuclease
MAVQEQKKLSTIADLIRIVQNDESSNRYELDEGELIVMPPTKPEHGLLVVEIAGMLRDFLRANKLGGRIMNDSGVILGQSPDIMRSPDVVYTSPERSEKLSGDYQKVPPDLVVEVVSPSDTNALIMRKVGQYFAAGVRLVWLVYWNPRQVYVYTDAKTITVLTAEDHLTGGDVLPGFSVPVRDVFAVLD